MIIALSDVHLGSLKTDYDSLIKIISKIRKDGKKGKCVVIGDLIESVNMYPEQILSLVPHGLDGQRILLTWFDDLIKDICEEKIIVLGNHELNPQRLNLIEFLKLLGWKIFRIYYCTSEAERNICFVHTSKKGVKGSAMVGRTPMMQAFDAMMAESLNADVLVTGHIHKMFNEIIVNNRKFIVLPSFQINDNGNIFYNPCMLLIDGEWERTVCSDVHPGKMVRMEERNIEILAEVFREYSKRYVEKIYDDANNETSTVEKKAGSKRFILEENERFICVYYDGSNRCFTRDEMEKVRELLKKGMSKEQISKELNISKPKLYAIVHYLEIIGEIK